jgi:hypothetical protein
MSTRFDKPCPNKPFKIHPVKQRGSRKLIRLTHKYSGRNSLAFWEYVLALKGKDHDAAYAMGVMLQDLEDRVLQFITGKLSLSSHRKK